MELVQTQMANNAAPHMCSSAMSIAQQQFYKRNEDAAIRTLFELEKASGAKVTQDAESVLNNISSLVCTQKEEFGTRKCRYVPLAVMKNVWMVKTGGHGREISEETAYSKETDTVSATVVLGDGFGGEYRTMREKPVDRSGFDTEVAQILRAKDLIRGTAWSACYASVQANNGYSKIYLDDSAEETESTPAAPAAEPEVETAAPKKKPGRPKKKQAEADVLEAAEAAPAKNDMPEEAPAKEAETPASTGDALSESVAEEITFEEAIAQEDASVRTETEEPAPAPAETAQETKAETEMNDLPFTDAAPAVSEEKEEKKTPSWPAAPLREIAYEDALHVMSPFIHHELGAIVGIGVKANVGSRENAVHYIERAMARGKSFDDDDVNAMLTIIVNNEDMKAAYDKRRVEVA